jgi:hypothetical protein
MTILLRLYFLVVDSTHIVPIVPAPPSAHAAGLCRHSERLGPRNWTTFIFPAFRVRDQTFALGLFPGRLPRSPDGLCFLASLALGRFFIGLATLHLTKNALALHLPLEDLKRLFDVIVANENLQMFSNRVVAAALAVGLS